jgi:hypothetical protein
MCATAQTTWNDSIKRIVSTGSPWARHEDHQMRTIRFAILAAALLATAAAFAQTAGGTQNTGPQGTGNYVAGNPEGSGNFVAGKRKDPAK